MLRSMNADDTEILPRNETQNNFHGETACQPIVCIRLAGPRPCGYLYPRGSWDPPTQTADLGPKSSRLRKPLTAFGALGIYKYFYTVNNLCEYERCWALGTYLVCTQMFTGMGYGLDELFDRPQFSRIARTENSRGSKESLSETMSGPAFPGTWEASLLAESSSRLGPIRSYPISLLRAPK